MQNKSERPDLSLFLRGMIHWTYKILFFVFLFFLNACRNDPDELFKRLSPGKTGIEFVNQLTYYDSLSVLEFEYMFNGAGVALIDINNDSLLDILFTGNMVSNRLYLNKGNLHFEDITEKAGIHSEGWCYGVAVVDINQDGYQDFYISKSGNRFTPPEQRRNLFYINNGDNTFTESAAKMGLDDDGYDVHAAFFDYDKDGDLDMYLLKNAFVNYNRNNSRPKEITGKAASTDKLFRNNGNGTFTDVSAQAGITIEGFGLGVNICDINNDNWPDIYVSNDFLTNDLMWVNNHDGTFTNKAAVSLRHETYNGMGNDVADFNNDGLPDIVVVDMLPPDNKRWKLTMMGNAYDEFQQNIGYGYEPQYVRNTLQLNNGNGTFSEIGRLAGMSATEWSWSPLFADFDNDGWKDLFIANGYREDITNLDFIMYGKRNSLMGTPEAKRRERLDELKKHPGINIHNYLFKNNGNLTFDDVSEKWGMTDKDYSNGSAYGDLDNDGDLDLVINNLDGPSFVYENRSSAMKSDNSFIRVRFKGSAGNRDGLGAKIWIWQNGKMQFSYFSPYRGYLSTVEPLLHFGIAKAAVDSLKVLWPDGNEQLITKMAPGKTYTVNYSDAHGRDTVVVGHDLQTAFSPVNNSGINYKHTEDFFVDFKIQPLLPHMHSQDGPGLAVGDINGDGREDFFAGAASGSTGSFFLQQANGKFINRLLPDTNAADNMGALLFDADSDGDLDLFLTAGGTSTKKKGDPIYRNKFYLNDGKGNFSPMQGFPKVITPASGVRGADYDQDGDIDLFICGRISPGEYPYSPQSFLLRNDSKNKVAAFTDITHSAGADLSTLGMVSDALWTDFDNDGWVDLLVAGEFMPLRFFKNEKGKFREITGQTGLANTGGWWNSLVAGDFDKDGDIDYIAGNLGLNGPYKASATEPVCVYGSDYDKNGRLDPILCHFINGVEYMVHSRDDINKQMTAMRGRFRSYEAYAEVPFREALRKDEIAEAYTLKAERFETSYIENLGSGKFAIRALPLEAQFSPVYGMLCKDFDGDGNLDVLCVGNSFSTEVQTGRYDAQGSVVMHGDGKGNFKADRLSLNTIGDNKSIVDLKGVNGNSLVIIGVNSDSLKIFTTGEKPKRIDLEAGDAYAIINDKDNRSYRQEFYYGQSYLSQGSRSFELPANTRSITIVSYSGKKRTLSF
ncbi:MAG: VCBS repeat-containing protein [Flavitalea sp.]